LTDLKGGVEVSDRKIEMNDLREQGLGILYIVVFIISAVTYIMWFRRAYYNLHLHVKRLSFSEGWAAGAWFVPIVNLGRPYKIMSELYNETRRVLEKRGVLLEGKLDNTIVGFWWVLWIINLILDRFSGRYALRADTIDQLITSTVLSGVSNLIAIPLAFLAIKVVQNYAAVEPLLVTDFDVSENEEILA
jgi:hypothetical protein